MSPAPICLSFDNGPTPKATPLVLATLARRGLPAVFFPIAARLQQPAHMALAQRCRAAGHLVGNHTLTHGMPLGRRPAAEAVAEIAGADALLGALREPARLFRPNGGGGALGRHLLNAAARDHLRAGGHTLVLWNAVPRDWDDPDGWPPRALALAAVATEPVMLVLHDLANGAMKHLDRVLGQLADAGHGFLAEPPPNCVKLRPGWAAPDLADYVTEETMP
jgi:peptidoglycan/xylan/chitin deacetylase (PgdA/CDA1 family)